MAEQISSIILPDGTQYDLKAKALDEAAMSITTSGTGNAITDLSESNGVITAIKGSTFVTDAVVTTSSNGLMSSTDKSKLDGIAAGATAVTSTTVSGWGFKTTDNNTTYKLTQDANDGHKITLTPSSGSSTTITIPDNDTTYSSKSAASNGTDVSLVTTGEKYQWNSNLGYKANDIISIPANQMICSGMIFNASSFRGYMPLPKYVSVTGVSQENDVTTFRIKAGGSIYTPGSIQFTIENGRVKVAAVTSNAATSLAGILYSTSAITFTFG